MLSLLDKMLIGAKCRLNGFLKDEEGDVNIVSIVVLIGIAVVLAIVFRDAIGDLLKKLFGEVENNATNAIKPK